MKKIMFDGIEVEVEECPSGICIGSIETIVDKGIKNWGSACVGFGALMKGQKAKKGKLKMNLRRR